MQTHCMAHSLLVPGFSDCTAATCCTPQPTALAKSQQPCHAPSGDSRQVHGKHCYRPHAAHVEARQVLLPSLWGIAMAAHVRQVLPPYLAGEVDYTLALVLGFILRGWASMLWGRGKMLPRWCRAWASFTRLRLLAHLATCGNCYLWELAWHDAACDIATQQYKTPTEHATALLMGPTGVDGVQCRTGPCL